MIAGHVLQAMPSVVDSMADPIVVDGIETTLYLDDSGSMRSASGSGDWLAGSVLDEGRKVLGAMGPLLHGPTRVIKFGASPTVLAARDADPPLTQLLQLSWDGSSGATYMWHMIEQDVLARYRPGPGKLRLIVVTDGEDTLSPAGYNGVRGMDPLMTTLHDAGYDVEWHVVVLGRVPQPKRYAALASATGGAFLAVRSFEEQSREASTFLEALRRSNQGDDNARRERQQQYQADARRGDAERFGWFKALAPPQDQS